MGKTLHLVCVVVFKFVGSFSSSIGRCLFNLGRAFCKIATLQETYALSFRDTYLASLADALKDFDNYASQRKKLDSRRYFKR